MTGEYSPAGQQREDGTYPALSPVGIAIEQTGSLRIALASPTFPDEVKELIRHHAVERSRRLQEEGEPDAAGYYASLEEPMTEAEVRLRGAQFRAVAEEISGEEK